MNLFRHFRWRPRAGLSTAALLAAAIAARGETTIDPAHPHAWGANIGWLNAYGDGTNGASVGALFCTGHVWSANCGWISMGHGPTNGWRYGNASTNDWGVNHDGTGRLEGHAWGGRIGWLTFEQTHGQPRIDLRTGNLSGHVWGANVGWISLSNDQAFVRTERIEAGPDADDDGIADGYEYQHAGALDVLHGGGADWDEDGVSDVDEYAADTDPMDDTDFLRLLSLEWDEDLDYVEWSSRPTRFYRIEATNIHEAAGGDWTDVGGGLLGPPAVSPTVAEIEFEEAIRYYRVRAVAPLSP